jgi:hypothetical protein
MFIKVFCDKRSSKGEGGFMIIVPITLRGKHCIIEAESYEDLDRVYILETGEDLTGSLTSEELGLVESALTEQYYVQAEARADSLQDR